MGMVVVSGSLLYGVSIPQNTLSTCVQLMKAMQSKSELPSELMLVPGNHAMFCLSVVENKIKLDDLKKIMKRLEIPWDR